MKTSKKIAIVLVVLVLVIGGVVLLGSKKTKEPTNANTNTATTTSTATNAAATITYSNAGFSPATTTVTSGDTVAIHNTSSNDLQLDSDPHPVHTDDADLNVGTVAPGQTKTFTVTKTGSFGFHNHLNSSDTGRIVVK